MSTNRLSKENILQTVSDQRAGYSFGKLHKLNDGEEFILPVMRQISTKPRSYITQFESGACGYTLADPNHIELTFDANNPVLAAKHSEFIIDLKTYFLRQSILAMPHRATKSRVTRDLDVQARYHWHLAKGQVGAFVIWRGRHPRHLMEFYDSPDSWAASSVGFPYPPYRNLYPHPVDGDEHELLQQWAELSAIKLLRQGFRYDVIYNHRGSPNVAIMNIWTSCGVTGEVVEVAGESVHVLVQAK